MNMREVLEGLGLPADAAVEPAAGGASGSAWMVRAADQAYALRLSTSGPIAEGRLMAMTAARAAGLPAPKVVRRASADGQEAVLLAWLPGITLMDVVRRDRRDAPHWGRKMGELQRRLHAVPSPAEVVAVLVDDSRPFAAGRDVAGLPSGDALLHLDWHPLNLLVDPGAGEICGIVDWDNARRGHRSLDLARTLSILRLDPSVSTLPNDVGAMLQALIDGWADGYGPEAGAIPEACHRWAAREMLDDLEPRYRGTPEVLEPIRQAANPPITPAAG
jgi:aminoglycoside phosphotransferase (APT) family kinase protein